MGKLRGDVSQICSWALKRRVSDALYSAMVADARLMADGTGPRGKPGTTLPPAWLAGQPGTVLPGRATSEPASAYAAPPALASTEVSPIAGATARIDPRHNSAELGLCPCPAHLLG